MTLDDERIERYSRQLILPEVGPGGQERLGAARVAVVGAGVAAERVVAYLAAAGVGWIAADPALHAAVDPAQPDVTVVPLASAAANAAPLDVVVAADATAGAVAAALAPWRARATHAYWIAAGRAGGAASCPRCAAIDAVAGVASELGGVRDVVLATVVATETVKAILAIGAPLAADVLTYDPATASVARCPASGHAPGCDVTRA